MILQMTTQERELMNALCRGIAVEQNSETFNQLICQLNDLLEEKHERLTAEQQEKAC